MLHNPIIILRKNELPIIGETYTQHPFYGGTAFLSQHDLVRVKPLDQLLRWQHGEQVLQQIKNIFNRIYKSSASPNVNKISAQSHL